jgi:preprotein translocase subunit SecA
MALIGSLLEKFFGNKYEKDIKKITPLVDRINEIYESFSSISNDELRAKAQQLKEKINNTVDDKRKQIDKLKEDAEQETDIYQQEKYYDQVDKISDEVDKELDKALDDNLPEAFAIVKDTARRFKENELVEVTANDLDREFAAKKGNVEIKGDKAIWKNRWIAGGNEIQWDMVHFDVQLIGGVVLHQGKIAEMATGEGKTIAATLPVFLNALTGEGVHLVTVNNYLAKRDAEWMGPLFEFHGLKVDCIDYHQPNSEERRQAYKADITYGTNNEFGFDYLRDNMALSTKDLVQRKHNYSIIDEVDSILIDDARTPLIISGPVSKSDTQKFEELRPKVEKLVKAQRELVNAILVDAKKKIKEENTTDGGFKLLQAYKGLPKNKPLIRYLSEEGKKTLLQKTENVYMQENQKHMHKVTDDLFFVIDEKMNSIDMTEKGIDLITSETDDSDFFILPDVGAEIAEIEKSDLDEKKKLAVKDKLIQDYAIKSERIHTIQQLLRAYTMFEKDMEYVVMDNKIKIVDEQTGRILEGRRYSDGLHQAIESKERVKVEEATQTFATVTLQNYFRMYKKLAGMTGTAETEAGEFWDIYKLDVTVIPTNKPIIRDDRNDLIYKTKKEKYNAVIQEAEEIVKTGRAVLIGTTSVEVSELLSRMLKLRGIKHNVLNAKLHQKEADIVAEAGKKGTVTIATNMAGRGTDIKLSPEVRQNGGLAIIGTERHDARRVDRQLRGRAGRQGDPGSSQFFVSLEDDLMRLFGSERIASLMDRLGLKEGEMIQHSMISKSIERAQKKVEENNFGIRKRLLEYDDVMNSQREKIYEKRRNALYGDRLSVDIASMMHEVCESVVEDFYGSTEFEHLKMELYRLFSIETPVSEDEFMKINEDVLIEKIHKVILETHQRKTDVIAKQAYPVIKDVYEQQSNQYENIVVPVSDGNKTLQVVTNLEKANNSEGVQLIRDYEKTCVLATIDENWKEHLREMDELRQSVQNASYEQKDPLLVYKLESFDLFKSMMDRVNKDVVGTLMKGHIPMQAPQQVKEAKRPQKLDLSEFETTKEDVLAGQRQPVNDTREQGGSTQPVKKDKKVGRNDPCPCGSGKKYKHCHGKVGVDV